MQILANNSSLLQLNQSQGIQLHPIHFSQSSKENISQSVLAQSERGEKSGQSNSLEFYGLRYVRRFWKKNVINREEEPSSSELAHLVHNLIHKLLLLGEEEKEFHKVHLSETKVLHQQMIEAVKLAINPGFLKSFQAISLQDI
jgi:hypothetical protein